MPDRVLVTLDHEVLDADAPFLHADDLAVVRGDGVFETLLVRDGRARVVEGHLSRLVLSARALGLPAPVLDDWRLAIEMAAEEWGTEKEGALRLVLTRGRESGDKPTAFVMVGPVADRVRQVRESGLSVMTLERGSLSISLPGHPGSYWARRRCRTQPTWQRFDMRRIWVLTM